ncbi:OB-fold nucleic acid binding domain-containing protein, partial [Vibrio sp. 10N.261.52.A1]
MSQLLSAIPLNSLSGVGAKVAEKLEKVGLNNVQDLLFHLPLRYEDRTRIYPIIKLHAGIWAAVQGKVMSVDTIFGKRKMLAVKISDGNGTITLRFFNFTAGMKNNFAEGKQVHAYGEIKRGNMGLEIVHPDYKFFAPRQQPDVEANLTPVYPTTEGLRQVTLRNLTDQALELIDKAAVNELLPSGLYDHQITLAQALH